MKNHFVRILLLTIVVIVVPVLFVLSRFQSTRVGDYAIGEFNFPDEAAETAFREAVTTAFASRGFSFSREVPSFLNGTASIDHTRSNESFWLYNGERKYAVHFMDIDSCNLHVESIYLVTASPLTGRPRIGRAERDQREIARELRKIGRMLQKR